MTTTTAKTTQEQFKQILEERWAEALIIANAFGEWEHNIMDKIKAECGEWDKDSWVAEGIRLFCSWASDAQAHHGYEENITGRLNGFKRLLIDLLQKIIGFDGKHFPYEEVKAFQAQYTNNY